MGGGVQTLPPTLIDTQKSINITNIIPMERISKISCLRTLSCHGLISLENYTKGIGKELPLLGLQLM